MLHNSFTTSLGESEITHVVSYPVDSPFSVEVFAERPKPLVNASEDPLSSQGEDVFSLRSLSMPVLPTKTIQQISLTTVVTVSQSAAGLERLRNTFQQP